MSKVKDTSLSGIFYFGCVHCTQRRTKAERAPEFEREIRLRSRAGPAQNFRDELFIDENKKQFILGTTFPDIRYLKFIEREKTHYQNCNWEEYKSMASSYDRGMYFHSIVDQVRENFIISSGVYDEFPGSKLKTTAIKFVEDRLLYNKIRYWDKFIEYFISFDNNELRITDNSAGIIQWHKLISIYLKNSPNEGSLSNLVRSFGFLDEVRNSIIQLVNEIESNLIGMKKISNLYLEFPKLMNDFIEKSK